MSWSGIYPATTRSRQGRFLERVTDHATNSAEMVIFMVDSKMVRHTLA